MKHANISIFIPHNGCPNKCSFCNQKNITGEQSQPSAEEVNKLLENASQQMNHRASNAEIAFFGGSFTAIDREYMLSLLKVAKSFVDNGRFSGIRVSTRPDCITPEILDILKAYKVTAIELGAQSMDDEVLRLNNRGHTKSDVEKASKLIKDYGFSLGLQMMTGLYGSSYEKDKNTGLLIKDLKPDTVRIYPTVIMRDTELEALYIAGKYKTLSFDDTVRLCCELISMFECAGISVIRVGLQSSESLCKNMIAGVFHPAFREICDSVIVYDKIIEEIEKKGLVGNDIKITVNPKMLSRVIGQKKSNLKRFYDSFYKVKICQDKDLKIDDFLIENCGG